MTKFVLHGGRCTIRSNNNDLFYKEIIKNIPDHISVLFVYFARTREEWQEMYEQDVFRFKQAAPGTTFSFGIADEDRFEDQMPTSRIIHIRGGEGARLEKILKKSGNLKKALTNKVVSGISAGAHALSTYYYSIDTKKIEQGLGILPIKTFCHYTAEQNSLLYVLEKHEEPLKTFAIPEEEFLIYNKITL